MNKLFKLAIPAMAAVLLVSCGNNDSEGNDSKKDTAEYTGHDHASTDMNTGGEVKIKDDKLNAVYQHYVHLTTALINGNATEAKIASNAIETGAKELEGGQKIAAAAAKITSASDIEAQRSSYSSLSNDFIDLVKKSGLNSGQLYVDYCPMALNDKGAYWLSSQKDIRNPYFGDKMMTCGEVKETINK